MSTPDRIFVTMAGDRGSFFERHEDHPGGEVWVQPGVVAEAARTQKVRRALGRREFLIQVDKPVTKPEAKAAPKTDDPREMKPARGAKQQGA